MHKLLIIGAAGHAKVIADLVKAGNRFEVAGFVDTVNPARAGEKFYGAMVSGGDSWPAQAKKQGICHAFPAFGDNRARLDRLHQLQADGWIVPAFIHPRAVVSSSSLLGNGSVVMAGAVVQADTTIGDACIVNTSSTIDHDCRLGAGVHMAPGCSLAGHVQVGELSMLGIGTIVRDRIVIGKHVTTGAGSVVVTDLPDNCLACGVPAVCKD
jgi:sugar O-acyltransferase (sialic acid O-acetyltransferase NeuD family)